MIRPAKMLYIGLMSGTSLDGVDAALVSFANTSTALKHKFQMLEHYFLPFPMALQRKIKSISVSGNIEIAQLAEIENEITHCYAVSTKKLCEKHEVSSEDISAIGAHGQTIKHIPATTSCHGYSLQLLDPSLLAALTDIDVTANFRQKDIALGGQGAPLVPAFHQHIFSEIAHTVAIINIGGIANISWVNSKTQHPGYDIGPGNTLLDNWYQNHHSGTYDYEGNWGRKGTPHIALLKDILMDEYFQQPPPKSTGPEYFNLDWLKKYLKHDPILLPEDVQATLVELTAVLISEAVNVVSSTVQTYICGGGSHNKYLIERINFHLKNPLKFTGEIGFDGDFMEAAAFAWLAMLRLNKLPCKLKEVTGAKRNAVLGGLFLAR